jgi:hypothetical protein
MTIGQNSDALISLTLNDESGNPIDIDTLTGLVIIAYQGSKNIVQKWSKNALSGYDDITIVSADLGQISVVLDRANLRGAMALNTLLLEVAIEQADARFEGGKRRSVLTAISLEEVTQTISQNITTLG